ANVPLSGNPSISKPSGGASLFCFHLKEGLIITSSPTCTPCTFSPTADITPAASEPSTRGSSLSPAFFAILKSLLLSPATLISITTSSAFGLGSFTSLTCKSFCLTAYAFTNDHILLSYFYITAELQQFIHIDYIMFKIRNICQLLIVEQFLYFLYMFFLSFFPFFYILTFYLHRKYSIYK